MRAPLLRASYGLPGELVVDNFGGGAGRGKRLRGSTRRGMTNRLRTSTPLANGGGS